MKGLALDFAPRTLMVTEKISEVLGFVPEEVILNEVKYVELFSKSRATTVELLRPDLIIERQKLLLLLARMAEEAGAKIFLERRFLSFAPCRQRSTGSMLFSRIPARV